MSDTEDRKVVDASPAEGDEDTIVEIAEDGEVPSSAGNTGGSAKPSLSAMVDDLDAMVRGTGGAASGGASQAIVQSTDEDKCSIHIGSVDYATTPQELATLFEDCGKVKLVTIATDKFSNRPKGYAYLQFEEQSAVAAALVRDVPAPPTAVSAATMLRALLAPPHTLAYFRDLLLLLHRA